MPYKPKSVQRPWMKLKEKGNTFDQRLNERDKRYNSTRWRRLRIEVLRDNPLCVHCKEKGIIRAAIVCDHIDNKLRRSDFWNKNNLQGLCHKCHNKKSQLEKSMGGIL